jgi:hypothetical protein
VLTKQDKPLFCALMAVAVCLFLNFALALAAPQPVAQPKQQPKTESEQEPQRTNPFWLRTSFWEMFATGVIAIYAIRQYREGKKSSERQLRAYLSVVIGGGTYQDRLKGLRFDAQPMILNNGATPAYKVRYSAIAKIIPDAIAAKYDFKIPAVPPISQASIGPKENRSMTAVYKWTIPDARAAKVFAGDKIALWVWGAVEYEDAFGNPRYTEFCQRLMWLADGKGGWNTFGRYDPRLGKST